MKKRHIIAAIIMALVLMTSCEAIYEMTLKKPGRVLFPDLTAYDSFLSVHAGEEKYFIGINRDDGTTSRIVLKSDTKLDYQVADIDQIDGRYAVLYLEVGKKSDYQRSEYRRIFLLDMATGSVEEHPDLTAWLPCDNYLARRGDRIYGPGRTYEKDSSYEGKGPFGYYSLSERTFTPLINADENITLFHVLDDGSIVTEHKYFTMGSDGKLMTPYVSEASILQRQKVAIAEGSNWIIYPSSGKQISFYQNHGFEWTLNENSDRKDFYHYVSYDPDMTHLMLPRIGEYALGSYDGYIETVNGYLGRHERHTPPIEISPQETILSIPGTDFIAVARDGRWAIFNWKTATSMDDLLMTRREDTGRETAVPNGLILSEGHSLIFYDPQKVRVNKVSMKGQISHWDFASPLRK